MRLGQWMTKRLGGCVPARSWRRKKKPTNNNSNGSPPHNIEARLTRHWIFVRPTPPPPPQSQPSRPPPRPTTSSSSSSSSSVGASSTCSTDPLTGPVFTGQQLAPPSSLSPPPSPRSCNPPTREVKKLRKSKSTASIPKQIIRKLSVTPPRTVVPAAPVAPVVAVTAPTDKVAGKDDEEEEIHQRGSGEELEGGNEEEELVRQLFGIESLSHYDRIWERVAEYLPEATVVYEHGRPDIEGEGEGIGKRKEEVERRVDEDPVQSVIVQQAAGESSFHLPQGTVTSVIVQSTAVEEIQLERVVDPVIVQSDAVIIDKEDRKGDQKDKKEGEEEKEEESSTALLSLSRTEQRQLDSSHPSISSTSTSTSSSPSSSPSSSSPSPSPSRNLKNATKTATTTKAKAITQLPTPSASASEQENSSDSDSGFTPTPPDVVDESADLARSKAISSWCLQQEDDQDVPGPGSLEISTYPYPRPTPILSENHRTCQPKPSILKPFTPPLIHPDMTTLPDNTKPGDVAVATAPPAKGKKGPADNKASGAQASPGEKKLTGKELKEAKKAEKQARRAADKLQRGDVPDAPAVSASGTPTKQNQASSSSGTPKSTQQQQGQKGKQQQIAPSIDGDAKTVAEPENKRIPFFEHLRENKPPIDLATINRDVHPSIVRLSMKLRNFEIIGSTARCLYMLLAFKEVINDYYTPEGVALSRNLTQHLNLQISQIAIGRKLSVSQGNAIRWLKTIASRVPPEVPDEEAKKDLVASIDTYMKERIIVAQDVIANVAADKIANGDVILTYAKSTCVQRVLVRALHDGKQFTVIVIDSRPYFEGRGMARDLTKAGIQVKYTTLHALDHVMKTANKVFLGAHAIFANGACYSRAGTSAVAMTAAEYQKPVMICCEGLKLSDKIVMDSITTNELGPTEALIGDDSPLQNHAEIPNLHIVNLLFDLTLPKYITAVITETGFTPPFGIPSQGAANKDDGDSPPNDFEPLVPSDNPSNKAIDASVAAKDGPKNVRFSLENDVAPDPGEWVRWPIDDELGIISR
ncbi:hypothetical protein TWF569_009166 [Orbilia oligospora]|nr:hypothetical protein TWF569_009166 [Orbilia oligospora]